MISNSILSKNEECGLSGYLDQVAWPVDFGGWQNSGEETAENA